MTAHPAQHPRLPRRRPFASSIAGDLRPHHNVRGQPPKRHDLETHCAEQRQELAEAGLIGELPEHYRLLRDRPDAQRAKGTARTLGQSPVHTYLVTRTSHRTASSDTRPDDRKGHPAPPASSWHRPTRMSGAIGPPPPGRSATGDGGLLGLATSEFGDTTASISSSLSPARTSNRSRPGRPDGQLGAGRHAVPPAKIKISSVRVPLGSGVS